VPKLSVGTNFLDIEEKCLYSERIGVQKCDEHILEVKKGWMVGPLSTAEYWIAAFLFACVRTTVNFQKRSILKRRCGTKGGLPEVDT
jgi:hypothetical protein